MAEAAERRPKPAIQAMREGMNSRPERNTGPGLTIMRPLPGDGASGGSQTASEILLRCRGRRGSPGRSVTEGSLREFFTRINRACARMNGSLAALAVALAVVIYATALVRTPNLISSRSGGHVQHAKSLLFGTDARPRD